MFLAAVNVSQRPVRWNMMMRKLNPTKSDWIAILALTVSGFVGLFTYMQADKWGRASIRSQINETLDKLTEIDAISYTILHSAGNVDERQFIEYGLQNRKFALLGLIDDLISQMPSRIRPEERAVLSVHFFSLGDYDRAEKEVTQFVADIDVPYQKAMGLRSLALLSLARGNSESAHEQLASATNLLDDEEGAHIALALVGIEFTRAQAFFYVSDNAMAAATLAQTLDRVYALPCTPVRSQLIGRVLEMKRKLPHAIEYQDQFTEIYSRQADVNRCIYDPVLRKEPPETSEHLSALELVGQYIFDGYPILITEWFDETYALVTEGQPTFILERYSEDELRLRGDSNITLHLTFNENGQVVSVSLPRSDGTAGIAHRVH